MNPAYVPSFTAFAQPMLATLANGQSSAVFGFRLKKGQVFLITGSNEELDASTVKLANFSSPVEEQRWAILLDLMADTLKATQKGAESITEALDGVTGSVNFLAENN